jgi:23S rRNA pseudouridine1911/1915/1917 synthase
VQYTAGDDAAGERVDKWLSRTMPGVSRAKVQAWIAEGRVRINGQPCRAREVLAVGQVIDVEPGPSPTTTALPDASVHVEVVFEDEHLMVVNKPAGLVVHPARGHATGTLVNGLIALGAFAEPIADPRDPQGNLRPGIVHRIDKDTSGLLMISKSDPAREGLKSQLASHQVERVYLALACGVPKLLDISTLYGRHPKSRLRFSSKVREGKTAVTHVRVLEILAQGHASLVECRLQTGRTHQIRVHLTEQAQSPLLADELYRTEKSSDPLLQPAAGLVRRQALHAGVLGFTHPITGAPLRFEVPPAEDFGSALEALRSLGKQVVRFP